MKIFALIMMMTCGLFGAQPSSPVELPKPTKEAAKIFAEEFASEALTALDVTGTKDIPLEKRMKTFRDLLKKGIAMKTIGKLSVGPYWEQSTEGERKLFHTLFEDFFVDIYAAHFKDYHVTGIKVVEVRDDDNAVWVVTMVSQKGKPDIKLEWKVVQGQTGLKILNVMIDGFLDFTVNLRKLFVEIIGNNGGNFSAIIKELQDKNTLNQVEGLKK